MDFKSSFPDSFISASKLSVSENSEAFLGRPFFQNEDDASPLLYLLSGGNFHALFPWVFDVKTLDCFLVLYTQEGCGKLLINGQVHSLDAGAMLLLDCRQRFRIDIAIEPWDYQAFFYRGSALDYFRQLFPDGHFALAHTSSHSDTVMCMEKLLTQYPGDSLPKQLIISDLLGHITINGFTQLFKLENSYEYIPSYLRDMRTLFDDNFQEIFSLDDLEKKFGISKYRLCREFSAAFNMPPLQYLNRKRIEVAKHLLLTTSLKVHEVGSRVGIDNTNHFISLFKKFTGQTPLQFKQTKIL